MSNFDKMIKLIEEKDIKGMEEWLKDTKRLFEEEDYYSIPNIKLLYEDENVVVHQGKYIMDGIERTPVNTTHFRDSRPWRQLVNRLAKG